ncbi:acid phosphatase [Pholiota conissans]|uniref:Acid phosphatase n=1 Tax=Pholiota conissans TaxID=109636 RepID=A0A9P5Z2Y0_9AGAR|nr:acid phosphatase [Pholiota conissans]
MILSAVVLTSLFYSAQAIVSGVVFDRYVSIWLENTDFTTAAADPAFAALTKKGLQLTNYFAVTHPSEPNYVSVVGGEYFGMNNDNLNNIPANASSVVDLLEDKGVSWGEYQEDMPSTGFTGVSFSKTSANDYVRKHNPLIIYDSVATNPARASHIKNFTLFQQDLANNALPQWMFITPNMTNDGHDTNVATASKWATNFLTPLLSNPNFNAAKTLIVLTFDESGTSSIANRVDTILLGSAVPASLVSTQDANYYNHYSEIATVEANWGLHTLGRYDVGANVFSFVASQTGDVINAPTNPVLSKILLNLSYPGPFNTGTKGPLPIPNTSLVVNGRTVLPAIASTWGSAALQKCTTYTGSVNVPSNSNAPVRPAGC